jgi:hypothetical protein
MNKTLTTVLIPLRVDSVERLENLLCVIKYLIKLDLYILIYEADNNNNGIVSRLLPRTKKILYKFIYDIESMLFFVSFRTYQAETINALSSMSETSLGV